MVTVAVRRAPVEEGPVLWRRSRKDMARRFWVLSFLFAHKKKKRLNCQHACLPAAAAFAEDLLVAGGWPASQPEEMEEKLTEAI